MLGDVSAVLGAIIAAAAIIGAVVAYLIKRRGASGSTRTSDAAVLWEQAQAMRAELVAQRDKAMEQRDRMIDSQSTSIIPALTLISQSLQNITNSLARLELAHELERRTGREGQEDR